MFNFFDEIVSDFGLEVDFVNSFNLINMSNRLVYVEGQKGIVLISDDAISFRVKKGIVTICGQNLRIKRITNTTLTLVGNIKKIESV